MNSYPSFPITPFLTEIISDLKKSSSRFMILSAETAAGKSTILPLALLDAFCNEKSSGKILMTEPRRIAALGVASRVAQLRGEDVGNSVGYKIHLENKVSKATKLEVVTEAVLVRMIQADPFLEDYKVIVIDEFHERSINTDLALAFLKETMQARDDLYVIVMSATMNMEKLKSYLGGDVAIKNVSGKSFFVEEIYKPGVSVEDAIIGELKMKTECSSKNILVFLPGIFEIKKCQLNLKDKIPSNTELLILHSSISLEEQKKVLEPVDKNQNRVILSSAIAETSLTVPGITSVIDTGFARFSRLNRATGATMLVTEIESEFSARQRKGRAGRVQNGRCIRLWNVLEPRVKDIVPEILRSDLSSLILECAERGIKNLSSVNFLDNPNQFAWKNSSELLLKMGFINSDGTILEKGKAALTLGLEPRLANIALTAGIKNFSKVKNIILKNSQYSQSSKEMQNRFISDIENRLLKCSDFSEDIPEKLYILAGYPDRLARRVLQEQNENCYQFASGRLGVLKNPISKNPLWIVASNVMEKTTESIIFEYEPIEELLITNYLKEHSEKKISCIFQNEKIVKTENVCFGQIILSQKKLAPEKDDLLNAWINQVQVNGFSSFPLDEKITNFLLRVKFYKKHCLNEPIEDFENYLCTNVELWLKPFMSSCTKLSAQILFNALYWFLDGSKIDENVPQFLILPNKTKVKIKYELISLQNELSVRPIIEVIIQRIFGCFEMPKICGKKVLLKLLSPANRPLQVTDDLENFWTTSWPQICKEMKGRYPKHNWDYKKPLVEK